MPKPLLTPGWPAVPTGTWRRYCGHQRLVEIGKGHVNELDILAGLFRPGEARLAEFGQKQKLLRAAAGHADLLALEIGNRLDPGLVADDDARTALGKAGNRIDRHARGTTGNGGIHGAGGHIDFARDDSRQDVDALAKKRSSICRLYLAPVPSYRRWPRNGRT